MCMREVWRWVIRVGFVLTGKMENIMEEMTLARFFSIKSNFTRGLRLLEVCWIRPPLGWYKANVDGVVMGNPGRAT